MTQIKGLEETYDSCQAEGFIQFRKDIDVELAKSLLQSALEGVERSKSSEGAYEKKTHNYSFVFTEKYDILRRLLDALLLFDKVKTGKHQCSNAYLCVNHKELEFDWETLETMRLLRNDVNYEGKRISEELWKSYKLKFEVYINTLVKEVKKKLAESEMKRL